MSNDSTDSKSGNAPNWKDFGRLVRQLRVARNLSAAELAVRADMGVRHLLAIENLVGKSPSSDDVGMSSMAAMRLIESLGLVRKIDEASLDQLIDLAGLNRAAIRELGQLMAKVAPGSVPFGGEK